MAVEDKKDKKTYYITTPIYYPSGNMHIGHSYTTVAADAEARYRRLKGYDVMFLTGTDEHGQKIQRKAAEKGVTPKEYVDEIVANTKELWKLMNVSNDQFIRTTDDFHVKAVQKIFKTLYDKGDIYKSEYEGWYCTPCESFWTETQLVDGKCPDCGRAVERTREESYFFRLSKYQQPLIDFIESHPDFIQPVTRKNEMLNNFLRPGLEDLCVSRTSFDWGIPVTFDEKHVVYVWVDALSNYITALGYGSDDDSRFKKYWPAQVHLVGKEIVRFHTIIWPALLMALDLPLPEQVYGHGWLLIDGGKMSKSKGNVIDPRILCAKYGSDAIRYFLLREVPFGSDGVFTNEALIGRINADLANDLGNLVSRTVSMQLKYFNGVQSADKAFTDADTDIARLFSEIYDNVQTQMDALQFPTALVEIWRGVSRLNKYIDETAPWVLAKSAATDPEAKARLAGVMYTLLEGIRIISVLIEPFMPETPAKIRTQLGIIDRPELTGWETASQWGTYPDGTEVKKGDALFPRIDAEKELEELEKMNAAAKVAAAAAAGAGNAGNTEKAGACGDTANSAGEEDDANLITIDDFAKVQMNVAEVISAEKVEGSDKLLLLKLSLGDQQRQVVSGIAKQYSPEEMKGKKVILVSNLKPAVLKGIRSEGMILAASKGKKLVLVTVDGDIPAGAKIS